MTNPPSSASVRDAHRAFRAALLSLSYPGRPFVWDESGRDIAPCAFLACTYEAETPTWCAAGWPARFGRPAAIPEAEVVLAIAGASADAITAARRGTEERPEQGATLVYLTDHDGPRCRAALTGPGIDAAVEIELPLSGEEIAARDAACAEFPLGLDVMFLDGRAVTGLPRTTHVQLLG